MYKVCGTRQLQCFVLLVQPPFTGNREKIQQKIVKEKIKLPAFLSSDAHSLLKGVNLFSLDIHAF